MYITKFIRKDVQADEEYQYDTKEEAINHLLLFVDDNSNLYKSISVLDMGVNITVLKYLGFDKDGRSLGVLSDGDTVTIRKEWRSPGEEKYIFVLLNMNEIVGRGDIICVNSDLPIPSSECVGLNMVETWRNITNNTPIMG